MTDEVETKWRTKLAERRPDYSRTRQIRRPSIRMGMVNFSIQQALLPSGQVGDPTPASVRHRRRRSTINSLVSIYVEVEDVRGHRQLPDTGHCGIPSGAVSQQFYSAHGVRSVQTYPTSGV
jgi:hypothetical protein